MRACLLFLPFFCLTACEKVGKNPWAHVDYAEANCGTKSAILTTTGCSTAPAASPTTKGIPAKNPNTPGSEAEMATMDNDISGNHNQNIYNSNGNTNIHGVNTDNTIHGIDATNTAHGNAANASVHDGNVNYNTTTTVLGSNLDNYHTNTGVYGTDNNAGSVYGNNHNEGNSTDPGVTGPVTGVYGANNTNSNNAANNSSNNAK